MSTDVSIPIWSPNPQTITILPTYRCNAECENCCFDSNPRLRQRISYEEIQSFINEASEIPSIRVCVFSGGECFLLGKELLEHIALAKQNGLVVRAVTNGYWARRYSHAQKTVLNLKKNGLDEINFSTGDQHARFVPVESVVQGAIESAEAGLTTLIVVELSEQSKIDAALINSKISEKATKNTKYKIQVIESPWMPMSKQHPVHQKTELLVDRTNVVGRSGCREVLGSVVLAPSGRLGACCGLTREQIPELNKPFESGQLKKQLQEEMNDFMKIWLRIDGPEKILAWASTFDEQLDWEGKFAHRCDACRYLFLKERNSGAISRSAKNLKESVLRRYVLQRRLEDAAKSKADSSPESLHGSREKIGHRAATP